jgi:hypothetical protein
MALRNANAKFEDQEAGGAAVADAPAASAAAPAPAAQAPKTTAVATAPTAGGALMASALKRNTALDDLQNVIDGSMLETMGFGAFPRVTVDTGGFAMDKTKPLGRKIEVELMSWNFVTLITTGEKDNKEADKLIRSSYDGINVVGGGTVEEYLKQLKVDGYDKASTKKYIELYANLLWTAELGEVAPDDQRMVQISLSPQSVNRWGPFLLDARIRSSKGVAVSPRMVLGSERKTIGANTFGVVVFGDKR